MVIARLGNVFDAAAGRRVARGGLASIGIQITAQRGTLFALLIDTNLNAVAEIPVLTILVVFTGTLITQRHTRICARPGAGGTFANTADRIAFRARGQTGKRLTGSTNAARTAIIHGTAVAVFAGSLITGVLANPVPAGIVRTNGPVVTIHIFFTFAECCRAAVLKRRAEYLSGEAFPHTAG